MNENHDKTLLNIDESEVYNDFYASVSILFRIASFVFLTAFLLFIVYSSFGNQEAFSYDNFEYIVRNFALTLDENRSDTIYSIRYNPDSSTSFALIGNKFALCSNSGISVFSPTGRLTCSDSFYYANPKMVTSDKYALIYDHGNCDYMIYNSFTKVHSQKSDKPIRGACMSDDGHFALITSSDEYTSTVEVYNENFKLINRFNKAGYVVGIDMSDGCVLIVTVDTSAEHDDFALQMQLYDIQASQTLSDFKLQSSFPISCGITDTGFFAICSDQTFVYDLLSEKLNSYVYEGRSLSDFAFTSDKIVLLLNSRGYELSYNLVAVDMNAEVLYDHTIDSTVYDIDIVGEVSCCLADSGLIILGSDLFETKPVESNIDSCKLLTNDDKSVYVCTASSAFLVNINE